MKTLFISWQEPETRRWFPIGRLTQDKSVFKFVYTLGAEKAKNFSPFYGMRQLDRIYESDELFPIFQNRMLSKSRPEYSRLIDWLSLDANKADPFVILSLTGGTRKTDSLEIFPCPVSTPDGEYKLNFFSRGLSHEPEGTHKRVNLLHPGEKLFLMKDVQNPYDMSALVLRTDDPVTIVGYCPRYLADDLNYLLEKNGPEKLKFTVKKVNIDAPFQLRLLCEITSPWPNGFSACSGGLYTPLAGNSDSKNSCGIS